MQFGLGLACGVIALLVLAAPICAQTAVGQHPLSEADQPHWAAIGQITYGGPEGSAICTGTLVAADLVLTAGHCVAVDGVVMQAGTIQFAAGWRAPKSLAIRHGAEIILAEPTAGQARSLSQDVALIVLDAPINAAGIIPLKLTRQYLFSEVYSFLGYRRDAPDILQQATDCPFAGTTPGLLKLECPVVSGNSGAPVLAYRHGVWQVAGVMAAAVGGAAALAVIPDDDLRARIAGD